MHIESGCVRYILIRRAALLALVLLGAGSCSPIGMGIGAAATVADLSMQERGLIKASEDNLIWLEINRRLLDKSGSLAQAVHIQVHEGRVLLTGRVDDREQRLDAVRAAWGAPWVRSVKSEIELAGPRGISQFVLDEWLIGRLSAMLFFDPEVRANNYSIECIDGVIYLVGVAQDQVELDRVTDHARDIAYVRDVVTEVRLRDQELSPIPLSPPPIDDSAIANRATSGAPRP